jgi:hypothetical protein
MEVADRLFRTSTASFVTCSIVPFTLDFLAALKFLSNGRVKPSSEISLESCGIGVLCGLCGIAYLCFQ